MAETKQPGSNDQALSTTPAERALAEAAARRENAVRPGAAKDEQKEVGGRKGPDPIRYGDWEKGGIASDF